MLKPLMLFLGHRLLMAIFQSQSKELPFGNIHDELEFTIHLSQRASFFTDAFLKKIKIVFYPLARLHKSG